MCLNRAPAWQNRESGFITVKETGDRIVWLRKIVAGGKDKSYGIQVARMAGLPPEVIARMQRDAKEK